MRSPSAHRPARPGLTPWGPGVAILPAILPALLLLAAPGAASAVEVELSPGDDVATLTATLQAGDVFTFSGGTYVLDSDVTWSGIGTEANPIILKAKDGQVPVLVTSAGSFVAQISEAEHVIIRGLVFSGDDDWRETEQAYRGMDLQYTKNVLLEGIEIRNVPRQGILIRRDNENVTLRRSKIHDSRDAQLIYVGDGNGDEYATYGARIENNWLYNGGSSAIEIRPNCTDIKVLDNVMYALQNDAIIATGTGGQTPNVIEGNAIWGALDAGLNLAGGVIARNNILFNIEGYGIYASHPGTETAGVMVISHNTVVNTTSAAAYLRGWSGLEGMVLANNALTNPLGRALDAEVGEVAYIAGNVATGLVELDVDAGGVAPGAGFEDYVNAQDWNFWPSGSSTLIGAGDGAAAANVPSVDFNGIPRDGDAPDAGAMEWTQSEYPGWSIREGFKDPPDGLGTGGTQDVDTGCGCGGDPEGTDETAALLFLGLFGWRRRSGTRAP